MKFTLHAGAELDLLTKDELTKALDDAQLKHTQAWSGIRLLNVPVPTATIAANSSEIVAVPRAGFTWSVRRVSVFGSTTATSLDLYLASVSPSNYIDSVTGYGRVTYSSDCLIVLDSTPLILSNPSASAVTVALNIGVAQVTAGDEWKL